MDNMNRSSLSVTLSTTYMYICVYHVYEKTQQKCIKDVFAKDKKNEFLKFITFQEVYESFQLVIFTLKFKINEVLKTFFKIFF